ncbi:MAG: hypothetical protein KGJ89_02890 [Patescibacteria group bacterium]|nr:hypothetical protein [Patescibacteria group bacterium]MDE2015503.1 hypothetical protein [Patescibacteria group bacterium]MDE2226881.1 hypothetical protein [Patescibacteria group bacterium]
MNTKNLTKKILVLISAGLIFSGYLSGVKIFSGTCAFNESCPYFLGYPSCWYGFGMYVLMFMVTSLVFFGKISVRKAIKTDLAVSFLGIIFSGSFTVQEIMQSRVTGTLGLSTCAYGLIFYILIFIFSAIALTLIKNSPIA